MVEELEGVEEQRLPDFLRDPIGTLRRRWRWMLGTLLAGSLASVALWSSLEPRYYADATVVMDRQNVSERVVERTIEEDSLDRIDAMAAQVLAREKLAGLVEQYDLYPEARRTESMAEVVERVQKDVTIQRAPSLGGRGNGAQVFLVGFEADRPTAAAGMANTLADRLVQVSIDVQHRKQELATDFLKRELETAERELREQDHLIADFKRENRGMLPDEEQSNLARLALLQQQRQSLALQIAEAETRLATLSSATDNSPGARLEALRDALRQELSRKTERHPDVIRLRTEIEALEKELEEAGIGTSPGALMRASEKKLGVLRGQLAETEHELKTLDSRVERMPAVQEQLAALEAKGSLLSEHYSEILRKVQDSELSGSLLTAQQADRVSVLNRAEPPTQPTKTRWKYLVLGLVASFGLSLTLGFALEAMDPVLVTAAQVEAAGGIPVIASVPRIS